MDLPSHYAWLKDEPGPLMLLEALKLYGTVETPGAGNNPTIMAWAAETGVSGYTADSVPWCGLAMAVICKRAGKKLPAGPLWALNWSKFGVEAGQPMLGDVLTFTRDGGGHVALYVAEDQAAYHVIGGNQSDAVSITRIDKKRLYRARRPTYTNRPKNVRPIIVSAKGAPLSTNEA
jgi:uncharacterized protein (TIGR02594 family)